MASYVQVGRCVYAVQDAVACRTRFLHLQNAKRVLPVCLAGLAAVDDDWTPSLNSIRIGAAVWLRRCHVTRQLTALATYMVC